MKDQQQTSRAQADLVIVLDVAERLATLEDVSLGLAERVGEAMIVDKQTGALVG